jgi:ribosomal protein L11 methyltransferase
VPYRIDLPRASDAVFDRLVELGALDAEPSPEGGIAALMPDSLTPDALARALGVDAVAVSPAVARDAGSVWVLGPRPIQVGRLRILPAHAEPEPTALRLIDDQAFGTGLHATTGLCLEVIEETLRFEVPAAVLDVGTGSGVLALAALTLGVPSAMGVDIDDEALRAAAENARLNRLEGRFRIERGGPEAATGTWPLVVANVLAAPLIEMAPALVRRVGHHGLVVLSGIPSGVASDVERAYIHLGMLRVDAKARAGWVALALRASW